MQIISIIALFSFREDLLKGILLMDYNKNTPVEDLDFSDETLCVLKRNRINTIGDIISRTEDDLYHTRCMEMSHLREIKAKITELNFAFKN